MTKRERQEAQKACTDQLNAILAKIDAGTATAEDQSQFDELFKQGEEHKKALDQFREQEKVAAEKRSQVKAMADSVGQFSTRVTSPPSAGSPNITRQHDNREDDPKRGFKSHVEFHQAVMEAAMGRKSDERLTPLRAAVGSDEQSTFSDSYGGYLVPEGFLPGLLTRDAPADPTAGRTTRIPMANRVVSLNARTDTSHATSVSGGLRVYRREEAGTVSSSRMQTELVKLEATALMGLSYATEEILAESPISFAALLAQGMNDEFGNQTIREKIRGTGVGQLEGVLNTPCLVTVTKETGQSADTFQYANLVKMRARAWRYSNSVWMYNHDCLPELMNLADGFGRLIWQPSAREGEPDLLLGRPAFPTEYCSTLGDAGDLILGDWSQYLEGTYGGSGSAESMHVRFVEHERAFKFWMNNAGKVWWRAALTPAVSTTTLSPFVVLQAR